MVALDYFVVTFMENSTVESYVEELRSFVRGRERASRHGYHGVQGLQSFFGWSSFARRYLLVLTGGYADECAQKINRNLDRYASIARIDIQSTFRVSRADEFIYSLKKSKRYKGTRIVPEGGFGTTMYVGSRTSDLFCRAYNKSYESELPPDARGEFVRIEFCLRDKYADEIFKKYRAGDLEQTFSWLVKRMFEEESAAQILERAKITLTEIDIELLRGDELDWRERRLKWLENAVVPAVRRLLAEAPWMEPRLREILDSVWGEVYNGY